MTEESLAHSVWDCTYHIVWIPKYRKKVLYGECRSEVVAVVKDLLRMKQIAVVEGVARDHIHLMICTEIFSIGNRGLLEREERISGVRPSPVMAAEYRKEQDFLGARLLHEYGWAERRSDQEVYNESTGFRNDRRGHDR